MTWTCHRKRLFAALAWLFLASPWVSAQPSIVTREQWGSKPAPMGHEMTQVPRLITIHHSGVAWKSGDDPYAKIRGLQAWGQKEKHWPDLPYHYLVAPSGAIFEGRDWHYRPESNTSYQLQGVLNVELWGNFQEQKLTAPQLRSLLEMLAFLCRRHEIDPTTMRGHRDAAPGQTVCPGADVSRFLDSGQIHQWTRELMEGRDLELPELPADPWGR